MRKHTSIIIFILVVAAVLSGCSIIRRDMYNPGDDGSKGSTAKITVDVGDGLVTNEFGASDVFTVVLAEAPASNVIFSIASTDSGEVTVSPSSLTFTAGNWTVQQVVTVTGVNDALVDNTQPVVVGIGAGVSSDQNWNGFDPPDVTVYNYDNDSPVTPGVTVSSSGSLLLSESGGSSSFAVVLGAPPSGSNTVTVPISVSSAAEATITSPFGGSSGIIVFDGIDWNTPKVVLISGVDDSVVDGNYMGNVTVGNTSSGDSAYNGINPPDVPFTNVDDDSAGITVNAGGAMAVSESGTADSFSVVLNSSPSSTVTIPLSVSDPSEGSLSAGSLGFTAADWNVPKTVTVTGMDDVAADGNVPFTVFIGPASSSDADYGGIDPPDVNFTNIDDDTPGVTVHAGTSMLVSESGTDSSFSIVLNSQPDFNVWINVSVSDTTEGVITAPFLGTSGPVTFTGADWSIPHVVTVAGVKDALADGNQPFNIVLGPTTSPDPVYNGTFDPPDVSYVCVDDYRPGVTVSAGSPMYVSESGTASSFFMVLNSQPANNVTINVSVSDASEGIVSAPFAGPSGTLVFTSGDWNVPHAVTVTGVGDASLDGDQGFTIVLGTTASSDPIYSGTFDPADVPYVCIDDDGTAAVLVAAGNPMIVSDSGTSSSFQVFLTTPPTMPVSVPLMISDPSEGVFSFPFVGNSIALSFDAGNWNIPQTVTVTGVRDGVADGNMSFWADFGPTSSADPNYNALSATDVQYLSIDDYSAGVTVQKGTPMYVSESGTASSFRVVLNSQPAANVDISFTITDISEGAFGAPFSGSNGSATFTSGNWNIPQAVPVMGLNDPLADGNRPFDVQFAATVSADSLYNGLVVPSVSFINIDDDAAGITVMTGSYYMVSESGTYCTFEVALNSQPGFDVTIPVSIDDASEGGLITPASGLLTFTPVNWNVPQGVAAGGMDDVVADGNQTFKVILGVTSSSDPVYNGIFDPNDVSFLNVDDDAPGITVDIGDGLITKEHPSAPLEDQFLVVLNSQPAANVSLGPFTSLDPGEVDVSPPNLVFTPGNWNMPQWMNVKGVDDGILYDDFQVVTVDLGLASSGDGNYNGIDPGDVTVYNLDDDVPIYQKVVILDPSGSYVTTENGAFAEIRVVLNTMPAANVGIGTIMSSNVSEGTVSPASLTFTPANWSSPQVIRVTGVNDGLGDLDVDYTVNLGVTSSGDPYWNGLSAGSVTVKNRRFLPSAPAYARTTAASGWASISGSGNLITFKNLDYIDYPEAQDEGYEWVPIGFPFHFMGQRYDKVTVFTNGWLSFNQYFLARNNFRSDALFDSNTSFGDHLQILAAAPWWDDITTVDAGSDAYYSTYGTAPTRVFCVEWTNARVISSTNTYNFQVRLYEGSDIVELVYGPKSGSGSGTNATAGIKDSGSGNGRFLDINGVTTSPPKPQYVWADFPASGTVVSFNPYP